MKLIAVSFLTLIGLLVAWTWLVVVRERSRNPPLGIFVPVAGGRLHVRDIGPRDAPPERTLVLIHGASSNHLSLTVPLAKHLEQRFRVIAIDRPGHGYSDRPGGRAAAPPQRQAALIAEALTALDISRAIVLGHSFAGAVATSLAMDFPEKVGGLVLLGPATHPWSSGITWYYHSARLPGLDVLFANTLPVPGFLLTGKAALDEVFSPQAPPPGYVEETALMLTLYPPTFRANAQDVAGLLDHVTARAGRYHEIRQPTVIISGDKDRIVSTEIHTRSLARELPNARTIILPGVGHIPHHADTARVIAEIEALSQRLGG